MTILTETTSSEAPTPSTLNLNGNSKKDSAGPLAEPRTLAETGLPQDFLSQLILKILYHQGIIEGHQIAESLCLRYAGIVDPLLLSLKQEALVEVKGGHHANPQSYRYALTEQGRQLAKEAQAQNTYSGPCPVPLRRYTQVMRQQAKARAFVGEAEVEQALEDLILDPEIIERVGPAVNSFKSLFIYGPPGNGKTSIAKAIGQNLLSNTVLVPHAIYADGQIIKVYDPETHQRRGAQQAMSGLDQRWVRCQAPIVIVGGEMTLRDLDLAYNQTAGYYEAPLQLKANGGLFLIDDFGRQQMPPKDLLNRWIVPLEEQTDYLTFHTGKKVAIPFETFIIFSTNLPPEELADEAFLRRIRHKLGIDNPTVKQFYQIFVRACAQRGLTFDQDVFAHLVKTYYLTPGRIFQACQARDLLDQIQDFALYLKQPAEMTPELVDKAARSYFARLF